jgi:hypothetical protein
MKNISTGFGLALLAGAIVTHTLVTNLASTANASAVTAAASAVSSAATAQTGPTIVWYGNHGTGGVGLLYRAWSDGKVEVRGWDWTHMNPCNPGTSTVICRTPWVVLSDPAEGLTYRSDINFDAKVDGADLGQLLADWGDAPRHDIPPSDCPLNLVNP